MFQKQRAEKLLDPPDLIPMSGTSSSSLGSQYGAAAGPGEPQQQQDSPDRLHQFNTKFRHFQPEQLAGSECGDHNHNQCLQQQQQQQFPVLQLPPLQHCSPHDIQINYNINCYHSNVVCMSCSLASLQHREETILQAGALQRPPGGAVHLQQQPGEPAALQHLQHSEGAQRTRQFSGGVPASQQSILHYIKHNDNFVCDV